MESRLMEGHPSNGCDIEEERCLLHADGSDTYQQPLHRGEASMSRSTSPLSFQTWLWSCTSHMLCSHSKRMLGMGDKLEKAAALIDLAEDGYGLPREVLDQAHFSAAARYFYIYKAFDPLWYSNLVVLLALNFFEIPVWCKGEAPNHCGDPKLFHLGGVPYLDDRELLGVELVSLAIFGAMIFSQILHMTWSCFRRSAVHVSLAALFFLLAADISINMFQMVWHSHNFDNVPRLAPYLRVIVMVVSLKDVRAFSAVLLRIIPEFLTMLSLAILYLVVTGWVAFVFFQGSRQGHEVFPTFMAAFTQMNNILTSTGNPDAWLPGYAESRSTVLFFIPILIIDVVFLLSLTLAVVYNAFKGQLGRAYKREEEEREAMLRAAFKLVDVPCRGMIDRQQFLALLEALNVYRAVPRISEEKMDLVFSALDITSDGFLTEREFMDLTSAIALKFERTRHSTFVERWLPRLFHSRGFQALRSAVLDKKFDLAVTCLLAANLLVMVLEAYYYDPAAHPPGGSSHQIQWLGLELIFGWLYVAEALVRVLVLGFRNFCRDLLNRFDLGTTAAIAAAQTCMALGVGSHEVLAHYLLILRSLRVARLLSAVPGYSTIVSTFASLVPALGPVAITLLCMLALFSSVGVQLFGGLIREGDPAIAQTRFLTWGYIDLNFNDYANAMVTLFQLLMGGPWLVFMEVFEKTKGVIISRAYFFIWNFMGVNFVTNVVIGFVLEAFDIELQMEKEYKKVVEMEGQVNETEASISKGLLLGKSTVSFRTRTRGSMRAKLLSSYDQLMKKILLTAPK